MKFVYIITNNNRTNLLVGFSANLEKTMDFYSEMPMVLLDPAARLHRLVFFKEFTSETDALKFFKEVSNYTIAQKTKLIINKNPQWKNIEVKNLNETSKFQSDDMSKLLCYIGMN